MAHIVTGALVIAKREDGSDLYLYEGAELPDSLDKDEVQRLVDLGLVGDADPKKRAAAQRSADKSADESK